MRIQVTDQLLYEYVPKVDEELLQNIPDFPELSFKASNPFQKKLHRLIRRSHYPRLHYHYMKTWGKVAVIILLVLAISVALTGSVKAVMQLRIHVSERIWHDGYVEERYSVVGEGEGVIKKLSYVPNGYYLIREDKIKWSYTAEYHSERGMRFVFGGDVIMDGTVTGKDTDYINQHTVVVRGYDVLIETNEEGHRGCYWTEEDIQYVILADDLEENELIRMIEEMK